MRFEENQWKAEELLVITDTENCGGGNNEPNHLTDLFCK